MEPGTVWDSLIESVLTQQKSQPSKPKQSGLVPLKLQREPKRSQMLSVERSLAEIIPALRMTIRSLVSGESPWPLVLHGPAGTGKTCAMLCLLDYSGGEYHTVSGLCQLMNRAMQGRVEWSNEGRGGTLWPEMIWARIGKSPLIVLDELGCRNNVSDAHYEVVKDMVDNRHRKPLAVLSNLPLATIGKLYDDRIVSRLSAGTVVELSGIDRRLE